MKIYSLLKKYSPEFRVGTPMNEKISSYYRRLEFLISEECNSKNTWVKAEEIKNTYKILILEIDKYVKNK